MLSALQKSIRGSDVNASLHYLARLIEGEDLDITIGHMPLEGAEKNTVKENVLKLLKEKYNIEEEDFISAEKHSSHISLTFVPH